MPSHIILQRFISPSSSRGLSSAFCTSLMIPEASIVQPSFVVGSEFQSAENTIPTVSGRLGDTLPETCLGVPFLSPTTAIFAACCPGCASPLHSPCYLLLSSRSLSASSRFASEVFFFECLSIDEIILMNHQNFGRRCFQLLLLPPSAHPILNSSGRLCFSHSASRLRPTSHRSSLTLTTSSSRINCSSLCWQSSVCLLAPVPDAAASQPFAIVR